MTEANDTEDWRVLLDALVSSIKLDGYLRSAPLERAFRDTPRHLFVPEFFRLAQDADGITTTDGDVDADDPTWLSTVYTNVPLMTQVKPIAGQAGVTTFTCSSSAPALMADMVEELQLERGMTVLEVGTGTGYNAAILCHLLGDQAVTTIDIDPELTGQARARLAGLGYYPSFDAVADTYDRILVTYAVADVPGDWIRWGKPGGVVLADLRAPQNNTIGAWLELVIDPDGATATGTLMDPRGYFMNAREVPELAFVGEPAPELTEAQHQDRAEQTQQRPTALTADVLAVPDFALYLWLTAPGLVFGVASDGTAALNGPRGESWAYVADRNVYYGGAKDLWVLAEQAFAVWSGADRPPKETWKIAVDGQGRTTVQLPEEYRPDRDG